ncbi:hypothetical protein [Aquabacterium sp. NJ1]|uniref:hypothetical protein n=1 Tax=Aquabacterium sp. NJ1 TaxID=1538295 RepID=UPI001269B862|nr:hypothetical protein [Aquabacterium sp. NJ1]
MNDPISQGDVEGVIKVPTGDIGDRSISTAIPGTLTQQIGSGEHAQNSIVYRTILWSFIAGGALSVAVVVIALAKGGSTALADIKDVWSVFAPIITLSLGYLFGKSK